MGCRIKTQRLPKQTTQDSKTGYGLSWSLSQTYFTLWENFSLWGGKKRDGKAVLQWNHVWERHLSSLSLEEHWIQITTGTQIWAGWASLGDNNTDREPGFPSLSETPLQSWLEEEMDVLRASMIAQSPHIMTKQLGVTLHQPGSQVTNVMAGKHIMDSKEVRIISHLYIHSFLYENLNCILIMIVLEVPNLCCGTSTALCPVVGREWKHSIGRWRTEKDLPIDHCIDNP